MHDEQAMVMNKRSAMMKLPHLNRRRMLLLGAGAAAGALTGLAPRSAEAVLKLDVTQGNI